MEVITMWISLSLLLFIGQDALGSMESLVSPVCGGCYAEIKY